MPRPPSPFPRPRPYQAGDVVDTMRTDPTGEDPFAALHPMAPGVLNRTPCDLHRYCYVSGFDRMTRRWLRLWRCPTCGTGWAHQQEARLCHPRPSPPLEDDEPAFVPHQPYAPDDQPNTDDEPIETNDDGTNDDDTDEDEEETDE